MATGSVATECNCAIEKYITRIFVQISNTEKVETQSSTNVFYPLKRFMYVKQLQ